MKKNMVYVICAVIALGVIMTLAIENMKLRSELEETREQLTINYEDGFNDGWLAHKSLVYDASEYHAIVVEHTDSWRNYTKYIEFYNSYYWERIEEIGRGWQNKELALETLKNINWNIAINDI